MSELTEATDSELVAELQRRGRMPRCRCGRWQTYIGAWDSDGRTLRCRGCLKAITKCWNKVAHQPHHAASGPWMAAPGPRRSRRRRAPARDQARGPCSAPTSRSRATNRPHSARSRRHAAHLHAALSQPTAPEASA